MAIFNNDLVYRGGGSFVPIPVAPNVKRDYTPMSWKDKNKERLTHALDMFAIINDRGAYTVNPDPEFDYAKKAEQMAAQAFKLRMQAAQQRGVNSGISMANSPISYPGGNYPKGKFGSFLQAISGQESGGNYGAINKDSGALGKYQIMPSNFAGAGGWDREALGRDVSSQQFLNNPRLQEAIARYMLRKYYRQYGPAGAASAWYSGDPGKWNDRNPQGGYPSIHQYVLDILRRMG